MNETRRALLDALAEGPASVSALAERVGRPQAEVEDHLERLRADGFDIERDRRGYAVVDVPAFGAAAVEFGLDAPLAVEYHETLGSTNDRARELAAEGAEDVVVLADAQTGGRGRLDRGWASPSGGVWLSVLLRPTSTTGEVPMLTLAAGVAVVRAVEPLGVDAGLKWPNDVLVPDPGEADAERKLAGVLTESASGPDGVEWVIVGVGLNANVDADSLPEGATSLREMVGDVDRRNLVQRFLEAFDGLRLAPDEILPAWRDASTTLGRRVRVTSSAETVVGTAVDVEHPGRLVVETDDGPVRVHAGDCEHLRPA